MAIFKVLSGVALGVGAVAAAPFTGGGSIIAGATALSSLAGAGAIAGAVAAGTAGGVAGYALHKKGEDGKSDEENKLKQQEIQKLRSVLLQSNPEIKNLVGLYIFGLAMANADGHISPEEEQAIDSFIAESQQENLPDVILEYLQELRNAPFSFEDAVEKAINENGCDPSVIDQLLLHVATSDEDINEGEQKFYNKWSEYISLQHN